MKKRHPIPPIGYLVSEYPAVSHTFIEREVNQLKEKGYTIHCASINKPVAMPKSKTEQVYYVKKEKISKILFTLFKEVCSSPWHFLKTLWYVINYKKSGFKRACIALGYFGEALLMKQWMRKHCISHLHVHFANAASDVALILSKYAPITFSMTVHGADVFDDVTLNSLRKKLEAARFVCCIGRFAQSSLMKLISTDVWPKLELAPMGINPEYYAPYHRENSTPPFHILCVGRLAACKGHPILIEACSQLQQEGYQFSLSLVGDGPDRYSIEEYTKKYAIHERVTFHGSMSPEEVYKLYQRSDIFTLASFAEGIPVSLMEAMSMGIPCVSTTIAGIPELIQNEQEGLLIPPADVNALSKALKRLIDEPKLRERLGIAGREKVIQKYNLENNIPHLAEIYSKYLTGEKNVSCH